MKEIVCSICKKEVEEQVDIYKPTWFGEYWNDKLVKVICRKCWDKGERFK